MGGKVYLGNTWACKAPGDSESVFCKVCKCTVAPKASALETHEATEKQKKQSSCKIVSTISGDQKKTRITVENDSDEKAQFQLAVGVACHCVIRSIDHLGEIIL